MLVESKWQRSGLPSGSFLYSNFCVFIDYYIIYRKSSTQKASWVSMGCQQSCCEAAPKPQKCDFPFLGQARKPVVPSVAPWVVPEVCAASSEPPPQAHIEKIIANNKTTEISFFMYIPPVPSSYHILHCTATYSLHILATMI